MCLSMKKWIGIEYVITKKFFFLNLLIGKFQANYEQNNLSDISSTLLKSY